jgi:hypothetical protein
MTASSTKILAMGSGNQCTPRLGRRRRCIQKYSQTTPAMRTCKDGGRECRKSNGEDGKGRELNRSRRITVSTRTQFRCPGRRRMAGETRAEAEEYRSPNCMQDGRGERLAHSEDEGEVALGRETNLGTQPGSQMLWKRTRSRT